MASYAFLVFHEPVLFHLLCFLLVPVLELELESELELELELELGLVP